MFRGFVLIFLAVLGRTTSVYAEAKAAFGTAELTICSAIPAILESSNKASRRQRTHEHEDWELDDFN